MTTTTPARADHLAAAAVRADDRAHVFHSWSAQGAINPVPVAGAAGSHFWDYDGNRYLDLASQLVNTNLGHQHPRLVAAIHEQADRLCTIAPGFANDKRGELARLIAEIAPDGLERVFFTNSGAEANENAVRMARLHTGRPKVLAAYRSYHGSTSTAIALSGDPRRWANDAAAVSARDVVHFFGPYPYRSAFYAADPAEEGERALRHLADLIALEGPQTIAAILLETVVGTNGVLVPPDGYLAGVRELCDRHGIVLIADEVMVGFGRVGEWFAVDRWGITPDLITFAKGVNSGYVPLGGVVISDEIADSFRDRVFPGGLTYSGHPLGCAVGVASIEVMREDGLIERTRRLGEQVVEPALRELASRHPIVGEVRGLGLMWALELVRDADSREPLVPFNASGAANAPMATFAAECRRRGVWPFTHFNRTHLVPPLTISEDELSEGISVLDAALTAVEERHLS